jgi:hypothetical protein
MNTKTLAAISAAMLVALGSTSQAQDKRDPNSMLFPAGAHYAGQSLTEWGQAFWNWALNITGPAENFPGLNNGPSFQINQEGPVFFLGDSFRWSPRIPENDPNPGSTYAPEQKFITVPAHTALYMAFDGFYSFRTALPAGQNEEQFLDILDGLLESSMPIDVILLIDGQEVAVDTSATSPYRVSTYMTNVPVTPDSAYSAWRVARNRDPLPPVLPYAFISDISALIKPLSVGEHVINVRVFDSGYGYRFSELQAVDWHITVTR